MVEHVGAARLPGYAGRLFGLLRPGGRLLNHGIASPSEAVFRPNPFVARYVFPDGELPEVGRVVSVLHRAGFEVRHVEGLREHYPLTLRAWVRNLEDRWDDAVREVGADRARVWRLYMAGAALGFEEGALHIHQVLAVRPTARGSSGFPLRPDWEPAAHLPADHTTLSPAASADRGATPAASAGKRRATSVSSMTPRPPAVGPGRSLEAGLVGDQSHLCAP